MHNCNYIFSNILEFIMAENISFTRNYHLSDGELILFSNTVAIAMRRDIDNFESYGVTISSIENFEELINEFQFLPDDEILREELSLAIEQRDAIRNNIANILRSLSARGKAVFGEKSARGRAISPGTITKMTESEFLIASNQVYSVAEKYLEELASEGVTEEYLENLRELTENFESAINNVSNMKMEKDNGTENKILKGNQVYALLTKYCEYGKLIWYNVSSSKYNDYVIYSSGSGGSGGGGNPQLPAPSNLRYDYAELAVRWNSVANATSYQVEISDNNVDWTVLYDGPDTEYFTNTMLSEHTYLRARARSSGGFSSFTSVVNIIYTLVLNGPTNLTHVPALPGFTWNSVINATAYQVELRDSNATDDDYIQLYFGNATQLYHSDQVGTYYVRIRAWNNEGTSPWMLLAYIINP